MLVFASTISAQEHAPTIDVCRADVADWRNSQAETDYLNAEKDWITNNLHNRTEIAKLRLEEIKSRIREMAQCKQVDPSQSDRYYETLTFYSGVQADRWRGFIIRHHLRSQLEREDAAGKR